MRLYLRGNKWWAQWSENGTVYRRTTKTTHRDEAEVIVASWGRKVDVKNEPPPKVIRLPRAGKPMQCRTRGRIYFASARGTDRIKIGFTQGEADLRVKELQTGCPYPIDLLASFKCWKLEERHYHRIFARDRVMPNAEWFLTTPDVMHAVTQARSGVSVCPWCTRPTGQ